MMIGSSLRAALAITLMGSGVVAQAAARDRIEVVIRDAGQRDAGGSVFVELRVLNDGDAPAELPMADKIEARLVTKGSDRRIWLERDSATAPAVMLQPGGFGHARYRLRVPADVSVDGAILSIPALSDQQVVIAERAYAESVAARAEPASGAIIEPPALPQAAPPPADRSRGNAFVGNFSAYQPIYAVYGPGTNSEARLQLSFKYHLFGPEGEESAGAEEGLHFAYTQRLFWDLGADSSPFRNIDFQPELIYQSPTRMLGNGMSFGAQAGISHESNGRDGAQSRSFNSIYIAPMAAVPLGGDYRLSLAPRLSFFVGDLSDNPDIRRYRGNTGLFAEIGKDDGLRLSTTTRFNINSGKGAFSADLSYPLTRLFEGAPSLYLFGQSFVGYGENLLDYNRRTTRFRFGVALVR